MPEPQLRESIEGRLEQVIPLLQGVSGLLEKRCDRFLTTHFDLTTPQYLLLLAALGAESVTLGTLSEHLGCSRGNVTGIVDRLERDGWLVRERSTEDRRVITVALTEKGARVQQIQQDLDRELLTLEDMWTEPERAVLSQALVRLFRELRS